MITFETQKDFEYAVRDYLLDALQLTCFTTHVRDGVGTKVMHGALLQVNGIDVETIY